MSENSSLHILFLTAWYPHRSDAMFGLFVKRHAEAVSLYGKVSVLFIYPDADCSKIYDFDFETENNLQTVRIYYKKYDSSIQFLNKLINGFRYVRSNFKGYNFLLKNSGTPDIIHVNVLTRAGLLALYLKYFYGIRYVITEHWSRYLPITNTYKGFIRKLFTQLIIKNASAVTTVTENLKNAMIAHGLKNENYLVIPNVVDPKKFIPSVQNEKKHKIVFTHISCFEDKSKNITGILRVIKKLSEIQQNFECRLVGEGMDLEIIRKYSDNLGITDKYVFFEGLKENEELIISIQRSDFLVLFSNYENFPVVINEAFACGLPVLSTNVGGIPEFVKPEFGILIPPRDENELLVKIIYMLDHFQQFDKTKIRNYALNSFSNEVVGARFYQIYKQVLMYKKSIVV